jgi:tetratricopeptide (TPR) repeat protein
MNLEKLKDSARKFEQKEDWRRAIEVYLKAIQQIESGVETAPDLSLYNRVGDLHLKTNDTAAAVKSYERAVDLYADQGFFNNAIALCGKILRVNPGRTQTYLKLAQLHARKNVVIEAKRNLIEFLERMNALGQLEPAFISVKEFADQFSGSQEIRMMLVELLRASSREDEAREQLEKLAGQIEGRDGIPDGSATRTAAESAQPATEQRPRSASRMGGLVFLDTGPDAVPAAPPPITPEPEVVADPVDGLILTEPVEVGSTSSNELIIEQLPEVTDEPVEDLAGLETTELEAGDMAEEFVGSPLDVVEEPVEEPDLSESLLETTVEDLTTSEDLVGAEEPDAELSDLELVEETPAAPDLPLIQVAAPVADVADLESQILDNPDDPELHRRLAEALLAEGDEPRALEEFELGLAAHEAREEWTEAARMANRLVIVAPDVVRYHQKLVELAYRKGDRGPLLEAYLSLGDALARAGAKEKAMAVYGRVREHDPENVHAASALEALAEPSAPPPQAPAAPAPPVEPSPVATAPAATTPPASPPPAAQSSARPSPAPSNASFIDLGSMILDEGGGPRDTRMRIERREPEAGDEQREFKEILEQFKRGIEENLDSEDYQAHYDLGIAFKEMGLLDEAIAEFQKALRAPEGRLRTSEALGLCFFDKGQHAIAETVLRRAIETLEGGDEAKIGLLYWLGRSSEAQGKDGDAIGSYERALAVDIRFMDLSERLHRLTAGPRG